MPRPRLLTWRNAFAELWGDHRSPMNTVRIRAPGRQHVVALVTPPGRPAHGFTEATGLTASVSASPVLSTSFTRDALGRISQKSPAPQFPWTPDWGRIALEGVLER